MKLIDKEKVLEAIETAQSFTIADHLKNFASIFADAIKRSISALPSPEEDIRLRTVIDGKESYWYCAEREKAEKHVAVCDDAGMEVDGPRKVAIRYLEDQPWTDT